MTYLESVDNALQLLTLLGREGRVGVTDVARALDVAPSTAHRLLSTFRQRGFVVQASDRAYIPGPALAALVSRQPLGTTVADVAIPHLESLVDELDETCHLVVRVDREVQFVASVEAQKALRISSRIGQTMPAHLTSGGKALLAELPAESFRALYAPSGRHGLDVATLERLERELETARRRGYAVNVGETERGIAAVARVVRSSDGRPIAAVSVSVPTVRYTSRRILALVDALSRTADQITAAL